MGTFLSKDPFEGVLTSAASQNGYAYAHGNPIRYTDPSGNCLTGIIVDTLICGAILGAVAYGAWDLFATQGVGLGGHNQGNFGAVNWGQTGGEALRGAGLGLVAGGIVGCTVFWAACVGAGQAIYLRALPWLVSAQLAAYRFSQTPWGQRTWDFFEGVFEQCVSSCTPAEAITSGVTEAVVGDLLEGGPTLRRVWAFDAPAMPRLTRYGPKASGLSRDEQEALLQGIAKYVAQENAQGAGIDELILVTRARALKANRAQKYLGWAFKPEGATSIESWDDIADVGVRNRLRAEFESAVKLLRKRGISPAEGGLRTVSVTQGGVDTYMNVISDLDVAFVVVNGVEMTEKEFLEKGVGLADVINNLYRERISLGPDTSRSVIQHGPHTEGMRKLIERTYNWEYFTEANYYAWRVGSGVVNGYLGSGTMEGLYRRYVPGGRLFFPNLSGGKGDWLVARLANTIQGKYPGLNIRKNYWLRGREIDLATDYWWMEVKQGQRRIWEQIAARADPNVNPGGVPVIGYVENMRPFAYQRINAAGGIAAGPDDLYSLLEILGP